jgi:predicted dehydrogenase
MEGEGIVDVTTHLVDLIQWECFPEKILDYTKDIQIDSTKRWTTDLTLDEFKAVTKLDEFHDYLKKDVTDDDTLKIYCNGEINYRLCGVHAKTSVTWAYRAPEGAGDTHYSIMRGTKANLIIRQGAEQQYKPTLYIESVTNEASYDEILQEQMKNIQEKYPCIELKKINQGWEVIIPEKYREGHEAHFARVTENFLEYLENRNMPKWEVPNMIAKYYTTTKALELAKEN